MSGTIDGGASADRLVGADFDATWNLTNAAEGDLNGVQNFTSVENLTGGTAADRFEFTELASGFGIVSGGSGSDTLDFSDLAGPVAVDLQAKSAPKLISFSAIETLLGTAESDTLIGANANNRWNLTGSNTGAVGTTSYDSFENLMGGSLADTFTLMAVDAGVSGPIDGGDGIDTLVGHNAANTWNLTGTAAGNLNSTTFFSQVENLTGGTAADTYVIQNTTDGFGAINGGSATGIVDTLDYAALAGPIVVDLQARTAPKLTSFTAIESLVGTSSTDTLIGANVLEQLEPPGDRHGYCGQCAASARLSIWLAGQAPTPTP